MKIAELFAEIGFKFDTMKLREASRLIGDMNVSSIIGATSLAGLAMGIKKVIDETTELTKGIQNLQATTGIDPVFAQKFEDVAVSLGAAKDEGMQFLSTLSKIQNDIRVNPQNSGRQLSAFGLMGININDIQGTTESLALKIQKALSKSFSSNDRSIMERRKSFTAFLASQLNVNAGLLKAFEKSPFEPKMQNFHALNDAELKQSSDSFETWSIATQNLNVALEKFAIKILPSLSSALTSFTNDGGLKGIFDLLASTSRFIERLEIISQSAKTFGMNFNNAIQQPIIGASKVGNAIRDAYSKPNPTVNNVNVTVHSSTPEEFVKRFDPVWKRYVGKADLQFVQST